MHQVLLPTTGGDYALLVRIVNPLKIRPGRLSLVQLPPGWALYFGSARGPGGLKARLTRHLMPPDQKRSHWHIDYLTASAPIQEIWWGIYSRRRECDWARIAAETGQPAHAFGASDCSCNSHLFSFGAGRQIQQLWKTLQKDGGDSLQRIVLI